MTAETYEVWESVDKCEVSLVAEHHKSHPETYENLTTDTEGRKMNLVSTFVAESWERAREIFNELPEVIIPEYKPAEEEQR